MSDPVVPGGKVFTLPPSIWGSIAGIKGCTEVQINATREDCKEKLSRSFSRIPQSRIERSTSSCSIGGVAFEQHSFLIIRNGKPILCFDYIYQIIGEYELAIALSYNNETPRQELFRCLEESRFMNFSGPFSSLRTF
jgi:hypothetical protein